MTNEERRLWTALEWARCEATAPLARQMLENADYLRWAAHRECLTGPLEAGPGWIDVTLSSRGILAIIITSAEARTEWYATAPASWLASGASDV